MSKLSIILSFSCLMVFIGQVGLASESGAPVTESGVVSPIEVKTAVICEFPICDVSDSLDKVSRMSQSEKADFLRNLKNSLRFEERIPALQGILEFGDGARKLFVKQGEEDWVIREADYLTDQARVILLRVRPLKYDEVIADFDLLRDLSRRYEVVNFFNTQIKKIESIEDLRILSRFADYAFQWASTTRQEDYFIREARTLSEGASQRIVSLWPVHEGVYRIRVDCVAAPCEPRLRLIDQLVIFDTLGGEGVLVSFANREAARMHYLYSQSTLRGGGAELWTGAAAPWVFPSQATIRIDPETGRIEGVIRDVALNEVLRFQSVESKRVIDFYGRDEKTPLLKAEQIIGSYRGMLGGMPGVFSVTRFADDDWQATFETDSGNGRRYFRRGRFDAQRGVLVMTSPENGLTNVQAKIVLNVRPTASGQVRAKGLFMLTAGQSLDADFTRIR